MGVGVNIGNTLENTTRWETGWGNPRITKEFVQSLAKLGFKTVRVPVAWDTYARDGRIAADKLARVARGRRLDHRRGHVLCREHPLGWRLDRLERQGAISENIRDFQRRKRNSKYVSYWTQIASYFAGRNERLIFEALNEETNFEGAGSTQKAYATLTRVNQLFIDTVRKTGGNNAKRLLIVTGYATDITKTTSSEYVLPNDTVPHRLLISVHYYTPWQFAGMTKDESWGKMRRPGAVQADVAELNRLFDAMQEFCKRNDLPAFIGEFGVTDKKETPSRVRWMTAVAEAALSRKMVPVLWDTGGDISRKPPYAPSAALSEVMQNSLCAPCLPDDRLASAATAVQGIAQLARFVGFARMWST